MPVAASYGYYTSSCGQISAGLWSCTAHETVVGDYPVHEFIYLLEGSIILTVEGEEHVFEAGDAFFIPQGLRCDPHTHAPTHPITHFSCATARVGRAPPIRSSCGLCLLASQVLLAPAYCAEEVLHCIHASRARSKCEALSFHAMTRVCRKCNRMFPESMSECRFQDHQPNVHTSLKTFEEQAKRVDEDAGRQKAKKMRLRGSRNGL